MADPAEAAAAANGEESPSANAENVGSGGANANANSGGLDSEALRQIMQGMNTNGGDETTSNSNAQGGQVDALSNILQNLGMPQQSTTSTTTTSTSDAPAATPAPTTNATSTPTAPRGLGGLTLSDLQGAMAGLATTSPTAAGPPLNQIVTADAVTDSGILESEEVKNKLISLLPEGQRTEDKLMENLRSPQVTQCLKSLTAALQEDGSFNSILANFQLDPQDGAAALASGNPVQAFLDCVLKSVEREKAEKSKDAESKEDEDGDSEMKE